MQTMFNLGYLGLSLTKGLLQTFMYQWWPICSGICITICGYWNGHPCMCSNHGKRSNCYKKAKWISIKFSQGNSFASSQLPIGLPVAIFNLREWLRDEFILSVLFIQLSLENRFLVGKALYSRLPRCRELRTLERKTLTTAVNGDYSFLALLKPC